MKCPECGNPIKGTDKVCPQCGVPLDKQDQMDEIIKDLLSDDEKKYEPKFKEVEPAVKKKEEATAKKSIKASPKNTKSEMTKAKTKTGTGKALPKGASKNGQVVVTILRLVMAASIGLFLISLFFNWFDLSGNGVNQGYIREGNYEKYMVSGAPERSVATLAEYEGALLQFSAIDLYTFGKDQAPLYKTIIGNDKQEKTSMVAVIGRYYMMASGLMIIFTLISLILSLISIKLGAMSWIRNLAGINVIIIAINYVALRLPFFNMMAVQAKSRLVEDIAHPSATITSVGIAVDEVFYPFTLSETTGLYVAGVFLGIWLILGIVLAEVKNRRDEIAIERGED